MSDQPPMSSTRKRKHSNDSVKRSSVACDRCRGRKTKCAGACPHPCAACVDARQKCVYSDAAKRVSVPESYLHKLQAQARRANVQPHGNAVAPPEHVPQNADFVAFTGADNWIPGSQGQYYYMGNSSSTYIANRLIPTTETLTWHLYPHYGDASWLRRPVSAELPQLPPFEFALRLYSAQRAFVGTVFSFLNDNEFHSRLKRIYSRAPDLTDQGECLDFCQVLLVFALGQMYSINQWTGDDGPPGFAYFKSAMKFLPDCHEDGSILFIEVLSYVACYLQTLNRRDAAYLYLGLAIRMAISLGLHQEVTGQEVDLHERERRRRVWWSTYSLDRVLSVTAGHPISIQDDDIDVLLPSPTDGEDTQLPAVLRCYTSLSRILGRIGEEIYRRKRKSGTNLAASVQNVMDSLSEWFQQIPPCARLETSDLDNEVNREHVSLYLYYYHCINMTARPLLLYAVRRHMAATAQRAATTRWEDGLPAGMVSVIHAAIAAARSSVSLFSKAVKLNLVATYGFIDGEQAFSSALLLVMVNMAFPYNEVDASAMDTSLHVLRDMADRGNRYIRACHSLLYKIRETIKLRPAPERHRGEVTTIQEPEQDPYEQLFQMQPAPLNSEATGMSNVQDTSWSMSMDDDVGLWTEVLESIGINMDRHWVETAVIAEDPLTTHPRSV